MHYSKADFCEARYG